MQLKLSHLVHRLLGPPVCHSSCAHRDIPRHIILDRLECRTAQHVEEERQSFGGFEELERRDAVVFARVHGDFGEGALVVEEGAAGRWGGHGGRCREVLCGRGGRSEVA